MPYQYIPQQKKERTAAKAYMNSKKAGAGFLDSGSAHKEVEEMRKELTTVFTDTATGYEAMTKADMDKLIGDSETEKKQVAANIYLRNLQWAISVLQDKIGMKIENLEKMPESIKKALDEDAENLELSSDEYYPKSSDTDEIIIAKKLLQSYLVEYHPSLVVKKEDKDSVKLESSESFASVVVTKEAFEKSLDSQMDASLRGKIVPCHYKDDSDVSKGFAIKLTGKESAADSSLMDSEPTGLTVRSGKQWDGFSPEEKAKAVAVVFLARNPSVSNFVLSGKSPEKTQELVDALNKLGYKASIEGANTPAMKPK